MARLLDKIPSWLKNKYIIAFVALMAWILFFDRNDLPTQLERGAELKELQKSKAYYEKEIEFTRQELKQLDSNPAMLEKYAREKYFMKKAEEELFVTP